MTSILDGKATSLAIEAELTEAVTSRLASGKKRPHLAAVLVGDNPASRAYVGHKVKACARVGFESTLVERPLNISQEELMQVVHELNLDPEVDGFIVQLPLPDHINDQEVLEAVLPSKDVDGFHPVNAGKMALDLPCFLPATPMGIMSLLERANIDTQGKHAVILGRSSIVGTPMALLLRRNGIPGNCTVTVCHSRTQDLADHTRRADILVAAIGRAHFVTEDMVKPGAVVIDVGINRIPDATKKSGHRLTGDVDFDKVKSKCSWITPVPGGVGPMTIASLMQNTLTACAQKDA
ncbi:MAG: bifunctional methylenetetrahydrofolate dehydrogenase/methenyltetrahydrofolate cyclohydrolase FolD [Flavobacteriales bacterium]|nr:bifunctional methylenetetrahydrofolate dehydrogenase/methenyltetrahydrofolate cyclohydrolase FolD [Flavobacteriales bacterium]